MILVSNTSPIIFLDKLKALHLLSKYFSQVFIPNAVYQELHDLNLPSDIQVRNISDVGKQFVEHSIGRLHRGELEAIALSQEIKADYICLDDLAARHKAQSLNLQVIGTIGILKLSYQLQYLSAQMFLQYLDELTQKHGMYLSPKLLYKLKQL
jgi:predicted nucleic acid-binding protein